MNTGLINRGNNKARDNSSLALRNKSDKRNSSMVLQNQAENFNTNLFTDGWLIVGLLVLAGIGLVYVYYKRESEQNSDSLSTPIQPHLSTPDAVDVCYFSSSNSMASAVPINQNELWTASHTVNDSQKYNVTCGNKTFNAIARCGLSETPYSYCKLVSDSSFYAISTDSYIKWEDLKVGNQVRISGCPDGGLEICFGTISQLNAFSKSIYIEPNILEVIRSGFSGGKVEVIYGNKAYFIGLINSCASLNSFNCSTSILVLHPESDYYEDPTHNILLKLNISLLGEIRNYPYQNNDTVPQSKLKYLYQAVNRELKYAHLFANCSGTLVTVGREEGVRIDFQGFESNGGRNFQAQINGQKNKNKGSTIACVIIPKKYEACNEGSGFEKYLLKRFRFALFQSLFTKQIVTFE